MCKWLRDILFPTNVLGKKKRCVKWVHNFSSADNYTIQWAGDRLQICHASIWINGKIDRFKDTYTVGGTFLYFVAAGVNYQVVNNTLYFNCTNVTSLIVNGEQLI